MVDKIKLVLALAVIAAAIGAFYYYGEQSLLFRVLGLLVAIVVGMAIALQTEVGRNAWSFVLDSRTEIRKVVWPSRKETTQSTILVMVMVTLVGIFLWLLDSFLGWAVRFLTGHGE